MTLSFTLFLIISAGCTTKSPTKTPAIGGYPYPPVQQATVIISTSNYPYPGPAVGPSDQPPTKIPSKISVPTPQSGKGVITGTMLTPGPGGTPYVGDLFLAGTVYANEKGYPPIIKFSETDSPKATVDASGRFFIAGIAPGNYALMVYSLSGTYIIPDDKGDPLIITLTGNEVKDVGILSIK